MYRVCSLGKNVIFITYNIAVFVNRIVRIIVEWVPWQKWYQDQTICTLFDEIQAVIKKLTQQCSDRTIWKRVGCI